MYSANNALSHAPPMSWICYSADGAASAGSSNIALGASGPKAIDLYTDDFGAGNIIAGTVVGKSGMECSSCHDVHNGARTKDVILLTGQLSGSNRAPGGYICTQCHLK